MCSCGHLYDLDQISNNDIKPYSLLSQVVNNDPTRHVQYTLKVTFQYKSAVMSAGEQAAIKSIWNTCASSNCSRDKNSLWMFHESARTSWLTCR